MDFRFQSLVVRKEKRTIHSVEHRAFVAALNELRIKKGYTQIQLAKALKKPQSFVSKCLSRERRIDVIEWFWFCEALEISPREFLRWYQKELDKLN